MNRQKMLFLTFIAGQSLSSLGDAIARVALGYLVYELTGSMFGLGTIFLISGVAEASAMLFGGPLLDRVERFKFLGLIDVLRFVTYSITPILAAFDLLQLWHLYAVAAIAGIIGGLFRPGASAALLSLVSKENLVKAISRQAGLLQVSAIIGPIIGGLIVHRYGAAPSIFCDAISFAASSASLFFISSFISSKSSQTRPFRYREELKEGLSTFRSLPLLSVLTGMGATANFGIYAYIILTVPFVTLRLGGTPETTGILNSCWGIGFVLGSLAASRITNFFSQHQIVSTALLLVGICNSLFAIIPTGGENLAFALQCLFGFSIANFNINFASISQKMTPDHVRGRVSTLRLLILQSASSLGSYYGGIAQSTMSMTTSYLSFGFASILAAGVGYVILSRNKMSPLNN